jgi:hypothetical protein
MHGHTDMAFLSSPHSLSPQKNVASWQACRQTTDSAAKSTNTCTKVNALCISG